MKKIFALFFALFYLISTTGFGVTVHYCGGEIESVNINAKPKSCCCDDKLVKAPAHKSCCKEQVKYIKTANHASTSNVAKVQPVKEIAVPYQTAPSTLLSIVADGLAHVIATTENFLFNTVPIYILHLVLRN